MVELAGRGSTISFEVASLCSGVLCNAVVRLHYILGEIKCEIRFMRETAAKNACHCLTSAA